MIDLVDIWLAEDGRPFPGGAIAGPPPPPVSPEAQAVLDKMTGLNAAEQAAIIAFVDSQVLSSNWSKLGFFQHYGLQLESNALISWLNSYTSIATNAPTHSPGLSYTFNGTTQYLDTTVLLASLPGYSLDDSFLGLFCLQIDNNNCSIFGTGEGGARNHISEFSGAGAAVNDSSFQAGAESVAGGNFYSTTREDSVRWKLWKNGGAALLTDNPEVSTSLSGFSVLVGARTEEAPAVNFFQGKISSTVIGTAIGIDQANFYANLVTLNTALSLA